MDVYITRKKIQSMYLRVLPPHGALHISAPFRMETELIEKIIWDKQDWIEKQKVFIRNNRYMTYEYQTGEIHFILGEPYEMKVNIMNQKPQITRDNRNIYIQTRPDFDKGKREALYHEFLREILTELLKELLAIWEPRMKQKSTEIRTKNMKTRWGSCNITDKRIWINLQLAKRPRELIEYVLVHELCHFFERGHNQRFYELMGFYLPNWKDLERQLQAKA